jgi:hypothetical protein
VPGLKLADVRKPASVVYMTDSGMAANNTTNPNKCITPGCMIKYGAWLFDDPGNDDPISPDPGAPDMTTDPNWCGPFPRNGPNGRAHLLQSAAGGFRGAGKIFIDVFRRSLNFCHGPATSSFRFLHAQEFSIHVDAQGILRTNLQDAAMWSVAGFWRSSGSSRRGAALPGTRASEPLL